MTPKRRAGLYLIALLVIAAVVGVYYMPQSQPVTPGQQSGPRGGRGGPGTAADRVPVLVATAKTADVPVYLDGVGTVRALNTVSVRPQVDGKLINVSFREGQDVQKGFVLAKIDPAIYQAAYDQAIAKKAQDEAQLANARLDLERYARLAASNAVNKQQLDTQKATVKQLEAQVQIDEALINNARANLSYTDVIAPISGRTGIRQVDEGNIVHAAEATAIVVLTQLRPISVFFSLPQQNLPELNKGQAEAPLPVEALGADGKTVLDSGKVVVIGNQVDQTTGTVKIRGEFPNANLQLWPGQFVNMRLLIDTLRNAIVVPTAAIQRGPNGTFVYVVKEDNTVTARQVFLAQQDDVQSVVSRGVQSGERVVTTGFARLTEGTSIIVSGEAPGSAPPKRAPATETPRVEGSAAPSRPSRRQ
jgi:multidrug efflux system membrane fusion protein